MMYASPVMVDTQSRGNTVPVALFVGVREPEPICSSRLIIVFLCSD